MNRQDACSTRKLIFCGTGILPVADNGARYPIDPTALRVSVKNQVSDRCGLWNAFSFLTFREIVVNLLQDF
ncbi:hypothetical protein QUA43_03980 [Microcoleus sp. N9_B4]|uniref:hypothetical protein n=1 Tax=Microcoleus sp. N9_B4 TaxID=3055386 RepID=UPI002FD71FF2